MTLQAAGAIDMGQIRTELELGAVAVTMADTHFRRLGDKSSGAISATDFYSATYFRLTASSSCFDESGNQCVGYHGPHPGFPLWLGGGSVTKTAIKGQTEYKLSNVIIGGAARWPLDFFFNVAAPALSVFWLEGTRASVAVTGGTTRSLGNEYSGINALVNTGVYNCYTK